MPDLTPLESAVLARGICSRVVRNINGLDAHVLESGHETHDSGEYERTGFQVGLQWYRSRTEGRLVRQRAAIILGPYDRHPLTLYRGKERLGGSTSAPEISSACNRALARGCSPVI